MSVGELSFAPAAGETGAATFHEAYAADGAVREHWQYLLGALGQLGQDEFHQRSQTLERILRDQGATYNDYSAGLAARPWSLDPIPLVLDSAEWGDIESGVRERAEVLNLVLGDLYGSRTLIRQGIIPPELVFSHPGFLRECQDVALPGQQQLIFFAADIARDAGGQMRVMSDRAQTPSGSGYALINRMAMARTFPSLFRDSHVHRLSLYFNTLRHTLNQLSPAGDVARVAVLTPGTYNETYFEHLYLANYLGYPLVQGGDLTVRDGYLWMKTLDGLNRIDVLLRRVDDVYCDPVELRSDSQLGVPGLLEAVRRGTVVVANPLGSGVLENRGLTRYLPAAARHFLGRDLALPSAPTWWCGDAGDRRYVLDNLASLVIKTIDRDARTPPRYGALLSGEELAQLRLAIEARPLRYVAQEYVPSSVSPVWRDGQGTALPTVLRSFAVAGESSYTVLPGGLTRVGTTPGSFEISNRLGSISKDTWVLASEPEKQLELAGAGEPGASSLSGSGMELPSRVVENLFWTGRYTERAEASLRLLRTVFANLRTEQGLAPDSQPLLLRAVTQLTGTYPGFLDTTRQQRNPLAELTSVVLDADRVGSVMYSLNALLGAVEQVKDFMSSDTQRILNDLRDEMAALPEQVQLWLQAAPEEALDALVTSLLALAGLAQESMMRGLGWHFLDMGRRIERSMTTLSLLRSLCVPLAGDRDEPLLLETTLLAGEALMTFRRRYQRSTNLEDALDLMLLDPANPRSLLFQLQQLEAHLASLPSDDEGARLSAAQRRLLEASSRLRLADLETLARVPQGQFLRTDLDELLAGIQRSVSDVAESVHRQFFAPTEALHPMGPGDAGVAQ